ncbi:MAG: AGE family epimerase/isomerase [Bacteroidota bacterium]|nr:AGE family epimerase/isomerase [Candidatus Kapabacteria bacterium]MDW8219334.1 AGE family epimerase/isomerase [Bacteroidota bacterium]
MDFRLLAECYRDELFTNILPFWLQHSIDHECGGFFTCLDRYGNVYDTDKFIWLQGRQVWTFAMLYNRVERRQEWLDVALHGARFLERYGADAEGNYYFSLTREGKPLVQPYNIFSDCFACMAFAQLGVATGDNQYKELARSIFHNILRRQHNWKGVYNKAVPGTRPLKNFSLPMILSNLTLELEDSLPHSEVEAILDTCVHEVMRVFLRHEGVGEGLILENVGLNGEFCNCFDGRLLNPGHGIEAMWFIMDIARRRDDVELIKRCKDTTLRILEHAWDREYGGIFYFLDVLGYPTQQLEWDQKLWWVHAETLVALAKAYFYTQDAQVLPWLERVHTYTWQHFRDTQAGAGEWFGYLNRRGEVLLSLKGGKWKGCFHIPRALYQCWKTFEAISEL